MSVPPRCICDDCTALFHHPLVEAVPPALKEDLASAIAIQDAYARVVHVVVALVAIGVPGPQIVPLATRFENHGSTTDDDIATQLAEMRVTTAPSPHTAILFALFSPVLSTRTPLPPLNLVTRSPIEVSIVQSRTAINRDLLLLGVQPNAHVTQKTLSTTTTMPHVQCACEDCHRLFRRVEVEAATPEIRTNLATAIAIPDFAMRLMVVGFILNSIGLSQDELFPISGWIQDHEFRYPSPGSSNMLKTPSLRALLIPCEAEADSESAADENGDGTQLDDPTSTLNPSFSLLTLTRYPPIAPTAAPPPPYVKDAPPQCDPNSLPLGLYLAGPTTTHSRSPTPGPSRFRSPTPGPSGTRSRTTTPAPSHPVAALASLAEDVVGSPEDTEAGSKGSGEDRST
ncbi:hypothetical protein C8J57DRAFT_1491440 [Mycena rebaudengoi]|nr:hypothetical protein C8J57DRAFT_1491440 [Mycena rebaudengoi]